jgi:hypothetical protein
MTDMRRLSIIGWMSLVLLAACGGKNTIIGTQTATGGGGTAVATITVTSSSAQIAADGSTGATISAVAKNASNAFVTGATITFTASAGGIAVTQGTTDANGLATATLTASGAAAGTNITVTATSTGASGNVVVAVVNIKETVSLTTSAPQIPSDGSKAATITALVRDANNNLLQGVTVAFTASSGGLTVTQKTTDATGSAIATLNSANDPTNRTITVTATAGTATATIPVSVTGTVLSVSGPPSLVLGSQGTYTVSIANSNNTGIANTTVTLASALGNTLSAATVVTDATGKKTFTVTAAKSGTDSITATALGATAAQSVQVSAQNFQFTTPVASNLSTNVNLGAAQPLVVTWTVNGVAQANQTVSFAATRGTLSAASAVTDASGNASVTISSTVAGPATVTASATGVSAQQNLEFIATAPSAISVQASPATIPTQGSSTITATVRDANNNLVENQVVDFQTVNDITGGTLSVASATTNAQGQAQTVYTGSTTSSATNGVVIQATVQGTAITATADLTVGGLTVFLSLGTGNQLLESADKTTFMIPYVVIAVDAAGNPVANTAITLTVHALRYYKGTYTGAPTGPYVPVYSVTGSYTITGGCPNEDANFSGVYSPAEDGFPPSSAPGYNPFGNQNGKLDPGGTAVASPAGVTTGANGTASFNVIYPEDQAFWVRIELIATTTVSGTESTANTSFLLPILASYLTGPATPPGFISPYGVANVCTNPN